LGRCIVFAHRRMDDVNQRKQCQCHQRHGERDLEHGGDFGFSSEVRAHSSAYSNSTALAADQATAHSVAVNGPSAGTSYYLRRNRATQTEFWQQAATAPFPLPHLPVSISASPLNSTIASGGTQQFTATVSNNSNAAVTWSATTRMISSSGLFAAPKVNTQTSVSITANSQADTSKSATANLTVSAELPALAVSPMSLSFAGQTGASGLEPQAA